jgi:hypothetical protein
LTLFITMDESGPPPRVCERQEPPSDCPRCTGSLDVLRKGGEYLTRCRSCGLLSRLEGKLLLPIVVEVPEGGWNPEFQAIFEEKLGFTKWVRANPPGVGVGPAGRSGGQPDASDEIARRSAKRAQRPS